MTVDIEKLRYTLNAMSEAGVNLLRTEPDKVDVAWLAAFNASVESTREAIED